MHDLDAPTLLGLLVLILVAAKIFGALAKRIGQPAVLGELVAGVVLGVSVLGVVDPKEHVLHLMAEIGVVLLLFEIGLETDLAKLLSVGPAAAAVALVGVVAPFALGYGVAWALGMSNLVAVVTGATLTATSVGITARVLSDLGRLHEPESRIVLGAAVIDDVLGLILLAVVGGLAGGEAITLAGVASITAVAFGFLIATLWLGSWLVPPVVRWLARFELPGLPVMLAIALAFGLAWLAAVSGSALIIGAFAAGLLLRKTTLVHQIEKDVAPLGHFFVPLFFVVIGAEVDLRVFNPMVAENRATLLFGGLLIVVAVAGKFAAGYAPFWLRQRKAVIGVGMVPRGEVGLIFAQMGLTGGVFTIQQFSAVTLMVMVTTFLAPPLLRMLFPPTSGAQTRPSKQGPPEENRDPVNDP